MEKRKMPNLENYHRQLIDAEYWVELYVQSILDEAARNNQIVTIIQDEIIVEDKPE